MISSDPVRIDRGSFDLFRVPKGTLSIIVNKRGKAVQGAIRIVVSNNPKASYLQYTVRYWTRDASIPVPLLHEAASPKGTGWSLYPLGAPGSRASDPLYSAISTVASMYKVMLTASSSDGKPSISATKSEPDIRVDVTLEVPTSMLVRPDPNGHVLPHYSLNVSARNHTIALLGPGDHFWHSLSVSSTAGSIHIPAVRVLRNFSLSTTGGDITSSGDVVAHSTAALDTTNGAITLAGSLSAGSDLTLSTTNGRVLIAGPVRMYNGGALKATTTNASIDLDRILLFPRQDICARITTTNAKVWFGVAPHSAEAIDSGTLVVDAATTNAAVTARVAVGVPFQWSATNTTLTPQPLIRVFGAPYWANVGSVGGPGRPSNKLKMASTNAAPIVVEGLEEPL